MVEQHLLLRLPYCLIPLWLVDGSISCRQGHSLVCVSSFPLRRFISQVLISPSSAIWGTILMLTAVCHDHSGLWANRFFLGVSEAAVAPGLTVVISMWYTRSEQPLRQAAWFLGNTFAGIFGGIVSYGIGHIKTIAPWKVCDSLPQFNDEC